MKKQKQLYMALGLLAAFILWTAAVSRIDRQPIGPNHSVVGLSGLNGFVHDLTGVHWSLYILTDWLGLLPLCVMLGFAILGLTQWIRRKRLFNIDRSILVLGGFYLAVMAAYGFFEQYPVNYRPVLIHGILEASYPSSTTLLTLTVMPTALMQCKARITAPALRRCISLAIAGFIVFMVVGRLVSGVHWVTDIIGSVLLSAGLIMMYVFFKERTSRSSENQPDI